MKVLNGHYSQASAYIQSDYPYGRTLRCKRRIWVEKADKGSQVGKWRVCTQTSNPKVKGEKWNTPNKGVYGDGFPILMLNEETGHVTHTRVRVDKVSAFQEQWEDYYHLLDEVGQKEMHEIGMALCAEYVLSEETPQSAPVPKEEEEEDPCEGLDPWGVINEFLIEGRHPVSPWEKPSRRAEFLSALAKSLRTFDNRLNSEQSAELAGWMINQILDGLVVKKGSLLFDDSMEWKHFIDLTLAEKPLYPAHHLFTGIHPDPEAVGWEEVRIWLQAVFDFDSDALLVASSYLKVRCPRLEWYDIDEFVEDLRRPYDPSEDEEIQPQVLGSHVYWNTLDAHRLFGHHAKEVMDLLEVGGTLANASRPLPGDLEFEGEFLRGIFYAVSIDPSDHKAWSDLGAYEAIKIKNRQVVRILQADDHIKRMIDRLEEKYPSLEDGTKHERLRKAFIEKAHNDRLPFRDRQPPPPLVLIDAVQSGITGVDELTEMFFGKDPYDYTEYATPAREVVEKAIAEVSHYIPKEEEVKPLATILQNVVPDALIDEEDDLELEEVEDGSPESVPTLDPALSQQWEQDEPEEEEEEEEGYNIDADYEALVLSRAADTSALTEEDAIALIEVAEASDMAGFRLWLLDQPLDSGVAALLRDWNKPKEPTPTPAPPPPEVIQDVLLEDLIAKVIALVYVPAAQRAITAATFTRFVAEALKVHNFGAKSARTAIAQSVIDAVVALETADQNALREAIASALAAATKEPEPEPQFWYLKKAIAQEDADLILDILLDLGEEELVNRCFEPKTAKGRKPATPKLPKSSGARKRASDPAAQIEVNKAKYEENKKLYGLIVEIVGHSADGNPKERGCTAVAQMLRAQGRQIGPTSLQQNVKKAWEYLHASKQLQEWFWAGLITWTDLTSGRGYTSEVESQVREKLQSRGLI